MQRPCLGINRAAQNGSRSRIENAYFAAMRCSSAHSRCRRVPVSVHVRAHGKIRPTHHDQEIRQPASLQYRHQHLCDARGPRDDGEGRRGFRRLRRQDRRRHHPLGAGADHLRAGKQGRPEPAADHFPAPADPLLRRQHADGGAALSRSSRSTSLTERAGKVAQADDAGVRRAAPFGSAGGTGPPQHGNVREDLLDVHAVRAARARTPADAEPEKRAGPRPRQHRRSASARSKRCRSASIDKSKATRKSDFPSHYAASRERGPGAISEPHAIPAGAANDGAVATATAAPSDASPISAPCR